MFSSSNIIIKNLYQRSVLLLLSIFLLVGCQSSPLNIHHQTDLSFSNQYKTIKIETMTPSDRPASQLIMKAIETALTEKGYTVTEDADLSILFGIRMKSDQRLELEQIPYRGNIATKTQLEAVYTASMLVNAIDTKTNKVVWKAFTTKNLNNTDTSKLNPKRLERNIKEVFESLPKANTL